MPPAIVLGQANQAVLPSTGAVSQPTPEIIMPAAHLPMLDSSTLPIVSNTQTSFRATELSAIEDELALLKARRELLLLRAEVSGLMRDAVVASQPQKCGHRIHRLSHTLATNPASVVTSPAAMSWNPPPVLHAGQCRIIRNHLPCTAMRQTSV